MPKYKTTIEVVTEADDQLEAMDIAGEYLKGNLDSGVIMKCRIHDVNDYKKRLCTLSSVILALVIGMGVYGYSLKNDAPSSSLTACIAPTAVISEQRHAMQPPLQTIGERSDFKNDWQREQHKVLAEKIPAVK